MSQLSLLYRLQQIDSEIRAKKKLLGNVLAAQKASPELVAAVSNAGGLGLAPVWYLDPDGLKAEVRRIRSLTDRPFGVNLNMDFRSDAQLGACFEENVEIIWDAGLKNRMACK